MDYPHAFVILMGMGTVFFGLVCLIALTTIMGRILHREETPALAGDDEDLVMMPTTAAGMPEPNRQEMAAAVCAAIAEELGTDITGLRIVSLRRV